MAIKKSRSKNLNDIRSSIRETLCKTRVYSRSLQIILNRKTLHESIRMQQSPQDPLDDCREQGADLGWDIDDTTDLQSNGRSPSPASSLASFDSTYTAYQQSDELPRYLIEISYDQETSPRKSKFIKRPQRSSLYKSHQKLDHRRVSIDQTKLVYEFQAFFQILYENRNSRCNIQKLIAHDWQILFNTLQTEDPIIFEKCLCLLISLIDENMIPTCICTDMLKNGLISLLKRRIWIQCKNNSKLICKLLTTLFKSQPTCRPLLFEMLVSTQILTSFIDATMEEISYDIHDYILFFHLIIQNLVEDLPLIRKEVGQLPDVPLLWTKLIDSNLITTMIKNFLATPVYKLRNEESVRLVLTILANILKISYANVDVNWATTILDAFPFANIEYYLSSSIEEGSNFNNSSENRQTILMHYHEFLIFYNQHYPSLCTKYNICAKIDPEGVDEW